MSEPVKTQHGAKYGEFRFGVTLPKKKQTLYLFADKAEVTNSGALVFHGGFREYHNQIPKYPLIVLALAPGEWATFYAASCLDGTGVAFD